MLLDGRHDVPAGLDARTINRWQTGAARAAPKTQIAYVLGLYAALPDADMPGRRVAKQGRRVAPPAGEWTPVTPAMRDDLVAALHRARVSLPQLLRDWTEAPEGMTPTVIRRWADGKTQTANPAWWKALRARLTALPDVQVVPIASTPPPHAKAGRGAYRPIPADQVAALRRYHQQTGITGERLLKDATDRPAGLDGSMIAAWMSGATRSALPEHVAYVLARYAAQSPGNPLQAV